MFNCIGVSRFVFSSLPKKWQLSKPVVDNKKKTEFADSRWMSGPVFHHSDIDPNHKQVRGDSISDFISVSQEQFYWLHVILWVTVLEVKISQSGLQRKHLT